MTKAAVRTRALPLTLALCVAYLTLANTLWSAPVTSPVGSYGILLNQLPSSNTGNDKTSSLLGVLNFDGAGVPAGGSLNHLDGLLVGVGNEHAEHGAITDDLVGMSGAEHLDLLR